MDEITKKKIQWDKCGRILCAVLIIVYFIFALTQSNAFRGEMFDQLKMQHRDKKEAISDGWQENLKFNASYENMKYLEMSVYNPAATGAKGVMRYWITDESGKTVWHEDVSMGRMTPAKFHRGVRGTIVNINTKLHKGKSYTLHLKAKGAQKEQNLRLRSIRITLYYQGFNLKKYAMLLTGIVLLFVLLLIPNILNDRWNRWLSRVVFVVTPAFCYFIMERFNEISIRFVGMRNSMLNLLVYATVLFFFYMLTNRTRWAAILTVLCTSGLGLANYYVTTYRGTSLMPVDFATIGTAANVATEYQYGVNSAILWNGVLILAFIFINVRLKCAKGFELKKRFIPVAVCVLVCILSVSIFGDTKRLKNMNIQIKVFNPTVSCKRYGYATVFASSIQFLVVKKPTGYSLENVNSLMKPYVNKAKKYNKTTSGKKPNIIVIMNEAFSDLSVLGKFQTNQDEMPFFHSLKENTVKGTMYMSSYGGQTANSEFEFLTGNTMAFLPGGSVAYQYQVKDQMGSLTSTLKSQGYQGNIAMHPFYGNGYNREKVYPLLGFSKFLTIEDFKNPQMCRNYITDQEDFDQIISEYQKAKQENNIDPFYLFNVTIQNHGGYEKDFDNFKQEIKITDAYSNDRANRYLSLIKKTDDALKNLITYFKSVDDPTIIVMFGDHQPKLPDSFYNKVMDGNQETALQQEQDKHKVPFIIWTNYDIKEQTVDQISPNYLATKVIDVAKVKETPYQAYLKELYKKYPVVTGSVYMDADKQLTAIDDLEDLPQDLKNYQMIQYYHMFAKDKRNDSLFYLK